MSAAVYTGPWALMRDLPSGVVVPVRTSVGVPRFIRDAAGFPALKELTPYGLLGIEDPDEFRQRYRERLEHHGVARIQAQLDHLADASQGRPLVLCCFEPDRADCHRGDFADWWQEQAGVVVPELDAVTVTSLGIRAAAVPVRRRRPGTCCHLCGGPIELGELIVKLGRSGSWVHLACVERELPELLEPRS